MDRDQMCNETEKKRWTSPALEALEMTRTAGGPDPEKAESPFDEGTQS